MHEFKHSVTIAKVMSVAGSKANFDTTEVQGFTINGDTVEFISMSAGSVLTTTLPANNFDAAKVIAELC